MRLNLPRYHPDILSFLLVSIHAARPAALAAHAGRPDAAHHAKLMGSMTNAEGLRLGVVS
jgi:hypothetical protein